MYFFIITSFRSLITIEIMKDILQAKIDMIYQGVNQNSEFVHGLTMCYARLVKKQSRSSDLFATETSSSTRYFEELVTTFQGLLRTILNNANYYVSQELMLALIELTKTEELGESIASLSWDLLTSLVQGEKAMRISTLLEVFNKYMLSIEYSDLTRPAWLCITAHIAALADWGFELPDDEHSYISFIHLTAQNSQDPFWGTVFQCLSEMVVYAPDETFGEASCLLAGLLVEQTQVTNDKSYPMVQEHISNVKDKISTCASIIFEKKESTAEEFEYFNTFGMRNPVKFQVQRLKRTILHLNEVLEAFTQDFMPPKRPSESSFLDTSTSFGVQFQQLPIQDMAQSRQRYFASVHCPRNFLVGELRKIISEEASSFVGYSIGPEHFRIFSGGQEALANGDVIYRSMLRSPLMVVYTPSPMRRLGLKYRQAGSFEVAELLTEDGSFFPLLLSMIQSVESGRDSDPSLMAISSCAVELLCKLPFFEKVYNTIQEILMGLKESEWSKIKEMVISDSESTGSSVNAAALLYVCMVFCTVAMPAGIRDQREPIASNVSLIVHSKEIFGVLTHAFWRLDSLHPTWGLTARLLSLICKAYSDQLVDMDREHRLAHAEFILKVSQVLLAEGYEKYHEEACFLCSEGLRFCLRHLEILASYPPSIPDLAVDVFKKMLAHQDEYIRNIAVDLIIKFSNALPVEGERVFEAIVKPQLVSNIANDEQKALCAKFMKSVGSQYHHKINNLIEEIVDLIYVKLEAKEPLDSLCKSLGILVPGFISQDGDTQDNAISETPQRLNIIEKVKDLLETVFSTYLYPDIKEYLQVDGSNSIFHSYPILLAHSLYSLGQQKVRTFKLCYHH